MNASTLFTLIPDQDTAMPSNPAFTIQPLKEPSFFQRLFGRIPKENAVIEMNNLLARAKAPDEVTREEFERIAERYEVDPTRHFSASLKAMYQRYLENCLSDRTFGAEELHSLAHLKQLLALNDAGVRDVHNEVTGNIYSKDVERAVSDGRLEPQEHDFIKKLQNELRLPDEIARGIYARHAKTAVQEHLDNAIKDERLSPAEEQELHAIAKSLGVRIGFDEDTRAALSRFRTYWIIENGEVPEIEAGINLQRSEKCYAIRDVEWHEMRTVTRRIRYGGPTARIRIAKGIYWRMGDLGVQRVSEDVMKLIDVGRVYLTNKRMIFMGQKKNSNIRLQKVLDFVPHQNGLEIQKDSGKSPFLVFEEDLDLFVLTLDRAIRDLDL